VFTTGIGTPLQDGKVRQKFYALLDTAGLPRIKFHGLRHSCASFLIAKGVPARMVMEWMRHSHISTTMNI
jgi:integrase